MTITLLALGVGLSGCSTDASAGAKKEFDGSSSMEAQSRADSGFNNVPEGVHVVLRKDAIPAIFKPEFVSIDEAVLPDDAEVIGVSFKGESRAYSINLLDGHEIVNDVVGGRKIAVTW